MEDISSESLQPSQRNTTTLSSTMTEQSISASPCDGICSSLTSPTLETYVCNSSTSEVPTPGDKCKHPLDNVYLGDQEMHAYDGTKELALQLVNAASTNTSAHIATVPDMSTVIV